MVYSADISTMALIKSVHDDVYSADTSTMAWIKSVHDDGLFSWHQYYGID